MPCSPRWCIEVMNHCSQRQRPGYNFKRYILIHLTADHIAHKISSDHMVPWVVNLSRLAFRPIQFFPCTVQHRTVPVQYFSTNWFQHIQFPQRHFGIRQAAQLSSVFVMYVPNCLAQVPHPGFYFIRATRLAEVRPHRACTACIFANWHHQGRIF